MMGNEYNGLPIGTLKSKSLTRHVAFIRNEIQIENPQPSPSETLIGLMDHWFALSKIKWTGNLPYHSGRSIYAKCVMQILKMKDPLMTCENNHETYNNVSEIK